MKREKKILLIAYILLGIVIAFGCLAWFLSLIQLRTDSLPSDTPAEGVGRDTAQTADAGLWLSPVCAGEIETALPVYTEGGGPVPEWYQPDEPMAAEGVAAEPHSPVGIDAGGIDWNICSTLWGWDGHGMELWEMELFAKIFYLEFWQPNMMLCEAGCDAMLGLWELDGGTMFETLSHVNEDGSYTFSTYPGVWEAEYDPDGLAWCMEFCEERFQDGPSWPAQYFRKGHYHDWGEWSPIPAYEIDGIYFSIGKEQ